MKVFAGAKDTIGDLLFGPSAPRSFQKKSILLKSRLRKLGLQSMSDATVAYAKGSGVGVFPPTAALFSAIDKAICSEQRIAPP